MTSILGGVGWLLVSVTWLMHGSRIEPQTAVPKKVDRIEPVAVVGCLQESKPDVWTLADASDPVPSTANAPSAKELAALAKGGARRFQLIGVSIFTPAEHRGHTVAIKGLPIAATPADRLNVTSLTMIAPTCSRPPGFH